MLGKELRQGKEVGGLLDTVEVREMAKNIYFVIREKKINANCSLDPFLITCNYLLAGAAAAGRGGPDEPGAGF